VTVRSTRLPFLLGLAACGCGPQFELDSGLSDRALVVRYFLDEANAGQVPSALEDAADDPLPLKLDYGPELTFDEVDGNRGLRWTSVASDPGARASATGSKLQLALDGKTAASIEIVADVQDAYDARFVYVGANSELGWFSLIANKPGNVTFYWRGSTAAGRFPLTWPAVGRVVVHLVLDTEQEAPDDRVRLYVDGARLALSPNDSQIVLPALGESIDIPDGKNFVVGNRDCCRSPLGVIYYAAIYAAALTTAEVKRHAQLLGENDDSR